MKKILLIIGLVISVNMMFAQTATLKIGTVMDPAAGVVLVPVTLEALDNPITGDNLISSWGWYIAYDAAVLNAGAPGSPATLVNMDPTFPSANYLTNIIANNPAPGWNTIAVIYSSAVSSPGVIGMKFFDIQFTYVGAPAATNVIWTSTFAKSDFSTKFVTNMADDWGNEFLLTLTDGFVGPTPSTGKLWTGLGGDLDWFNPGNWAPPGYPTTEDVTINASKAPMVVITGGPATCGALTVALGAGIEIQVTGSLTTNGLYTNNGLLLITDDGPIGSGYAGSFIDLGGMAGTGTFEFDRNVICSGSNPLNIADPFGWHYLAAPIDGFTTDNMWDYYVKDWNEAAHMWMGYDGVTPCVPYSPAAPLMAMDAWSVNYDSEWPYTGVPGGPCAGGTGGAVEFMGPFPATHSGPYAAPYTFTPGAFQGWNMMGNPYPSGLAMDMIAWPGSLVAGAAYYDGCAGNYVYWTPALGAYTMSPTLGFFVEANAPGVLALTGAERAHGADWFWKDDLTNLLTLKANGEGGSDVTSVRFMENVTAGFDNNGDFHKLISTTEAMPQIYTKVGSEMLAVNALPETELVHMGFTATTSGSYTIEAIETSEFANVVLEDCVNGVQTDLLSGSYTFDYTSGAEHAFIIHFTPLGTPEHDANSISIWSNDQKIYVQAPSINGDIVVYNLMGQEVVKTDIVPGTTIIPVDNVNTYYIVKVLGSETAKTGKVYVK